MSKRKTGPTRRAVLAGLGGVAAGAAAGEQQPPAVAPPYDAEVPVRGKAGPGLGPFDAAMTQIMDRHGVPGAALAIAKNGKLLLAKGYGWANLQPGEPVSPDARFGLASLSKPITAAAALKLVEDGKLNLDARPFRVLNQLKAPGGKIAAGVQDVTVRQCLNHSGGWDRSVAGDPTSWEPQICRSMHVPPPLSPTQFLSFMLTVPLNFRPGTAAKYSNVGYIALGEVVAKVSGQPYAKYVAENVLKPMGVGRVALRAADGKYLDAEVHRHLAGTLQPLPALRLPMVDAAGGWVGSAVDMVRFLTGLDGSRGELVLAEKTRKLMFEPPPTPIKPNPDGSYIGLGWDRVTRTDAGVSYFKDGSYQGMRTFMKRLPSGVAWVLLYNASMEFDPIDAQIGAGTVQEVRKLVEEFDKYPDIDLFKDFP